MNRNRRAAGALMAVALTIAASVMAAEVDFSDLDDELMSSMDDAIKELDSNVSGQDATASLANAEVLREGFAWVEKYFSVKPEAPRGEGFAREGKEHLEALVRSIEANDFDAASNGVRAVVRSCKACHDLYKPPEL